MNSFSAAGVDAVVLGGRGFIGSAVVRALPRHVQRERIAWMVRAGTRSASTDGERIGDVRDLDSVRMAVRGSQSVVHTATYVGYDPAQCEVTNVIGTRNVVDACRAEGVERLVYVSTASVYGSGPHTGPGESELARQPTSALSRSRAAAEDIVMEAGGVVLRPHMVFGRGDRWFVPAVVKFVSEMGALVEEGGSLISVIQVDDLADCIAALSAGAAPAPGEAFNASYRHPVALSEVVDVLHSVTPEPSSPSTVSREEGRERADSLGYSSRQFELLTTDHWYDSGKLAAALDLPLEGDFVLRDGDASWYRTLLAEV